MFQLELLRALNEYFSQDKETQIQAKEKLLSLISSSPQEYLSFIQKGELSPQQTQALKSLEQELPVDDVKKEKTNSTTSKNDNVEIIKKAFLEWEQHYELHQKEPGSEEEQVIENVINYFLPNNLIVLKELLKIEDSQNFEDFKAMLQNYMRKYYSIKIEEYLDSQRFKSKSFFAKKRKQQELILLAKEIHTYQFNETKIKEVLS